MFPELTGEQIDYVTDAVKEVLKAKGARLKEKQGLRPSHPKLGPSIL
jgi:hypothetical protein